MKPLETNPLLDESLSPMDSPMGPPEMHSDAEGMAEILADWAKFDEEKS